MPEIWMFSYNKVEEDMNNHLRDEGDDLKLSQQVEALQRQVTNLNKYQVKIRLKLFIILILLDPFLSLKSSPINPLQTLC